MNPLETYYCDCSGASDPTYPTLKLKTRGVTLNFKPNDYLVYERVGQAEYSCMISFQKETRVNTSYWVLGDSFMRAFYTIYDGENKRIGLVGDTEIAVTEPGEDDDDSSA